MKVECVVPISSRNTGTVKAVPAQNGGGHVDQFGAWAGFGVRQLGLQRHAADRAIAGIILPNLRMHRAI